jgi:hypothetical protein
LHALARAWTALAAHRPAFRLRIIAESEGAFALSALASAMQPPAFAADAADFFSRLDSVDLVAPPLTDAEYSALALFLNAGWGRGAPDRRARVHLPFGRDEKRLAMPPYGRSYFELVRRAFHSRAEAEAGAAPAPIVSTAADGIADKWNAWRDAPRTTLVPITWPARGGPGAQGPIRHVDLIYRSDVGGRLRDTLSPTSAAAPASRAIA